jgi:hypothetical protein
MGLSRNPPDEAAGRGTCERRCSGRYRTALCARAELRWARAHRAREAPWGHGPQGLTKGGYNGVFFRMSHLTKTTVAHVVRFSISFVKAHVTQGHLYEKVVPIGDDLVPIYSKMILAGLHVAELDE